MVEIYLDVVTSWWFWGLLILVGPFCAVQTSFDLPKRISWPRNTERDHYVVGAFAVGGFLLAGAYWMYLHDII